MNKDSIYHSIFVADLFNKISNSYDKVNRVLTFGFSSIIRNYFLKSQLQASNKPIEVLDFMSGNGETWKQITKQFPNCRITAVDISEEMTKNAIIKNRTFFNNSINVVKGNVLETNLSSNSYDIVICAFGLKHLNRSQTKSIFKETFRLLKSGGRFVFFDISKPANKAAAIPFSLIFKFMLPLISKIYTSHIHAYRALWLYLDKSNHYESTEELFVHNGLEATHKKQLGGMISIINGYKHQV